MIKPIGLTADSSIDEWKTEIKARLNRVRELYHDACAERDGVHVWIKWQREMFVAGCEIDGLLNLADEELFDIFAKYV
jgi:hypothetical protein